MKLTARLPAETFAALGYRGVHLGQPLSIYLYSDLLLAQAYDDTAGWYERLPVPLDPAPALVPVAHDLYAFRGEVQQTELVDTADGFLYCIIIDCGLPLTLLTTDLQAQPGQGDLGQHVPDPGAWLSGCCHLAIASEDEDDLPLTAVLTAAVIGIDRLILRPGPGFGTFRPESQLPPTPIGPDRIYLTLAIA